MIMRKYFTKIVVVGLFFVSLAGCTQNKNSEGKSECPEDTVEMVERSADDCASDLLNSVKAHDERDTIWGNFTGKGIDTLFVVRMVPYAYHEDYQQHGKQGCCYVVKSSNPSLPKVRLVTCLEIQPKLVFEGDLDGNGVDEWGFLETATVGQWRTYRVYTFKYGSWRYLIDDEFTSTNQFMRASGKKVVEPGLQPGWVKVNYCHCYGNDPLEMRDTLLKPTFSRIRK